MTQKPRIAIIVEFPTALGGERSLLSVLSLLHNEFDFVLFSPAQGQLFELIRTQTPYIEHVPLTFRTSQGTRKEDESVLAELLVMLEKIDCQLLHGNSVSLARFLGRHRSRFPLKITAHLRDIMKLSKRAITDISQVDQLFAVSKATARSYFAQGVTEEKIKVIYNGISPSYFFPTGKTDLRKELNLPEQTPFTLTVGQLGLRKGLDTLIETIISVASSFPDWHFVIAGERYSNKAESIEYIADLKEQLKKQHCSERVHWLGSRNDIADLLDQSDLLIHAAREEPFGRVLLEAALLRQAILATNVGGTEEMLSHNKNAWLVPPNDPLAMKTACEMLFCDQQKRNQLGLNAQREITSRFPLERSALEHAKTWKQFL